ncbi:helix-turn-helix domain-containing protein [uncultured Treponema sp.]|uniref:helix-turn-helix domain-containing protein n=1 Tax=uncultured Treponema sp. TaxID=162155 RepID=UPI0025CD6DA6|nr:helix-turn-helix transcriptional regulator [uncultured Treponema sp.]
MADTAQTFKDRLVEEMNYQGISNKEFASKLEINIGTLGMYLYRGSIPSADIAVKMAKLLNTSVEYLVSGRDSFQPLSKAGKTGTKMELQKKEIVHILDMFSLNQLTQFLEITKAFKNAVIPIE